MLVPMTGIAPLPSATNAQLVIAAIPTIKMANAPSKIPMLVRHLVRAAKIVSRKIAKLAAFATPLSINA
jgi:hypothetical protein